MEEGQEIGAGERLESGTANQRLMNTLQTAQSGSLHSACSPSFRRWLRSINPGFYTHCSWSWMIGGVLVTHWGSDNVKIYHQSGRHTETHPANTERCREAIQELLSKANAGALATADNNTNQNTP